MPRRFVLSADLAYVFKTSTSKKADMRTQTRAKGAPKLVLTDGAVVRLGELLRQSDVKLLDANDRPVSFLVRVFQNLRAVSGVDFAEIDIRTWADVVVKPNCPPDDGVLTLAIAGAWRVLNEYAGRYGEKPDLRLAIPIFAADFEARVNEILTADRAVYRFSQGKWILAGETEAEVLRRTLLRGDEDVAACRQGDVQVEMVVSTVQGKPSVDDVVAGPATSWLSATRRSGAR